MLLKLLFWPFYLIWWLVSFVFKLTGKILAAAIGFVLLLTGIILTCTVVGAVFGIPFIIFGFLLCIKALF